MIFSNFFLQVPLVLFLASQSPSHAGNAPNFLSPADLEAAPIFNPDVKAQKNNNFFWVCLQKPKDQLKVKCDDLGINRGEGPKEELQIFAHAGNLKHEYGERHGILRAWCREMKKDIESMFQSSKPFCIRGNLIDAYEGPASIPPGKTRTLGWVFWEAKNRKKSVED